MYSLNDYWQLKTKFKKNKTFNIGPLTPYHQEKSIILKSANGRRRQNLTHDRSNLPTTTKVFLYVTQKAFIMKQ